MEPIIREEFTKRSGYEVGIEKSILQHPFHPFMLADVDGIVIGLAYNCGFIFEAKTASSFNAHEWELDITEGYLLQVQHYMAVTGYTGASTLTFLREVKSMFANKRYVTNGVNEKITQYMQNLLWYILETMKIEKKDYLQVFKLSEILENGKAVQRIVHIQEQPAYEKVYTFSIKGAITAKIFIIDDGDHSTMLLAEEY